jgi:hypothetical protein
MAGQSAATQNASVGLMRAATELVKSRLRDPNSAQFKDMVLNTWTCATSGHVNAKNGFGGYVGFKPFIIAGVSSETTVHMLEGDAEDFMRQWRHYCT